MQLFKFDAMPRPPNMSSARKYEASRALVDYKKHGEYPGRDKQSRTIPCQSKFFAQYTVQPTISDIWHALVELEKARKQSVEGSQLLDKLGQI